MSYTVEVSNVTRQNRNMPLRRSIPNKENGGYIQDFHIPAYALNHKLTFDNEDEFKKWCKTYEYLVAGKNAIIKIGKSSGHSLERQNKDVEKEEAQKLKEDQAQIKSVENDMGIKTEVEQNKKKEDKK